MIYNIFTDPHIDKTPVANTTSKSRKRWKQFLFDNALGVAKSSLNSICVGDLFDKTQVDAKDISKGATIASHCKKVLGGNHDVENSADSFSALNLVSEFCPRLVTMPVFNKVVVHTDDDLPGMVFVPHHTTKSLFDQALDTAAVMAQNGKGQYLFLHCNYNCDMASKETELNLTREKAEVLLQSGYRRIFIGHDHNRKTDFGDRVVVIGSVSPTSFGDCENNHGFYTLDADTDTLTYQAAWVAGDRFMSVAVRDLTTQTAEEFIAVHPDIDLIRIVGDVAPGEAVEFSRALKKLWKVADESNRLFAIKVDAKIRAVALQGEAIVGETGTLNLKAQILNELADSPELLNLWKEILEELK